ncbi:MAG: ABC transporter permease, partial [Planctomycetes bacterium]|nr:ABC transporter permease [Planctomycetota bacterium]
MNRSLLFRGVLAKDLKTLLRDRQQLFAVIIGLLSAVLTVGSIEISIAFEKAEKEAKAAKAAREKAEAEAKGVEPSAAVAPPKTAPEAGPERKPPANPFEKAPASLPLWLVILCGTGVGWYASFFVLPLGFATFAGERERGTLEVVLATPVPDATLYAAKTL